jgi:hypothetical protein
VSSGTSKKTERGFSAMILTGFPPIETFVFVPSPDSDPRTTPVRPATATGGVSNRLGGTIVPKSRSWTAGIRTGSSMTGFFSPGRFTVKWKPSFGPTKWNVYFDGKGRAFPSPKSAVVPGGSVGRLPLALTV